MIQDLPDVSETIKNTLLSNIRRRMAPQPTKIRADVDVICYGYEGIDAVKTALRCGLAVSTPDMPVKINLIAPPLYVMTTMSLEKDLGVEVLRRACEAVRENIVSAGGSFHYQSEPRAVTESDDKALAQMLQDLEKKQTLKDGDDDNSSEEDDDDKSDDSGEEDDGEDEEAEDGPSE